MDYVKPHDVASSMLTAGCLKLSVPPQHLLIRGALAGAFLAIATSMSVTVAVETGYWIIGSLLFPFGLVLAVLLGMEVITGSFALLPCAAAAGKDNATGGRLLMNWGWVFLGNLLGSLLYAVLFVIAITTAGDADVPAVGAKLIKMAEAKTNYYAMHGSAGLLTVFTKAVLCNWMVSLAVVFAYSSNSLSGKILAMWGPTLLFFSQGFEHTVVNMFVIPAGMLLGGNVSVANWWLWNQIPVTVGNLVGGMVFTGLAIYMTHRIVTPSTSQPVAAPLSHPSSGAEQRGYSPSF
jgi:formate/nitrite transporter